MNVMLLAAGEGTRLRPFTYTLPKPAIPFLNVPLAAHALGFLDNIKIQKLVLNTYHLPHKIHELFHNLPHGAQSLHFSDESGEILGSGGGLGKARSHFQGGGSFLLMNADEVILPEDSEVLKKAILEHERTNALATLLVMDHPGVGTQFGGAWTDAQQNVIGFGKTAIERSAKGWHFVGVQILSERIFNYIPLEGPSNILYDAVTAGIAKGEKVQVYPFSGSWFETGNSKDFLEASEKCFDFLADDKDSFQKRILSATLNKFGKGLFKIQKQNGAKSLIAENAGLNGPQEFEGLFVAGYNCVIGKHCHFKNVIVGNDVSVPENTVAEDTLII